MALRHSVTLRPLDKETDALQTDQASNPLMSLSGPTSFAQAVLPRPKTARRRRLTSDWLRIGAGIGGDVKGRTTSRYTDTSAIVAKPLALVILRAALPRGLLWRAQVCGTAHVAVIAVGAFIATRTRAADTDVNYASHAVTVGTCCAANIFVCAAVTNRDQNLASGIRSAIEAIVRVTIRASVAA